MLNIVSNFKCQFDCTYCMCKIWSPEQQSSEYNINCLGDILENVFDTINNFIVHSSGHGITDESIYFWKYMVDLAERYDTKFKINTAVPWEFMSPMAKDILRDRVEELIITVPTTSPRVKSFGSYFNKIDFTDYMDMNFVLYLTNSIASINKLVYFEQVMNYTTGNIKFEYRPVDKAFGNLAATEDILKYASKVAHRTFKGSFSVNRGPMFYLMPDGKLEKVLDYI